MNLVQVLAATAKKYGAKTAIDFEGERISFENLFGKVSLAAAFLEDAGVEPGDRVAVRVPKSIEMVVFHLAAIAAGAVSLPLSDRFTPEETRYRLADSKARILVVDRAGLAGLGETIAALPAAPAVVVVDGAAPGVPPGLSVRSFPGAAPGVPGLSVRSFDKAAFSLRPGPPLMCRGGGADTAMICYTSGTTGKPKGAMLSHTSLLENMEALREAWRWTEGDVLLHVLPLFHVHGLVVALHGALNAGSTIIMHRRFNAVRAAAVLESGACTLFMGVPTMYSRLADLWSNREEGTPVPLPAMRLFVSGSAPLPTSLFGRFRALTGHAILERYGMTEAGMITTNPYPPEERKPGSAGYPLRGVEIRIVEASGGGSAAAGRTAGGGELPPGETGEVEVRGTNLFSGYFEAPEKTRAAFHEGWFRTGDLGRLDATEGFRLYLSGRAKELIISGGFNVYPLEVEAVLERHPALREAAVIGLHDEDLGECVAAVVVPAAGPASPEPGSCAPPGRRPAGAPRSGPADPPVGDPLAGELLDYCRRFLAPYKCPRRIVTAGALPRNAMGKVQKGELSRLF